MNSSLRYYRKQKGWTQQQLADHAGLHRVTISRLECGLVPIWGNALAFAFAALDVPDATIESRP